MENVLGRGEQYCKGDGVGTKLSQWGPVRPVCERDSAGYRQESPCESCLVAGKQRPVDKGNLGLSPPLRGVHGAGTGQAWSLAFSSCSVGSFSHIGAILSLCSDV